MVASWTGAKLVTKEQYPELVRAVENASIAAGLEQPPQVRVVDDPCPNAFAAGGSPKSSYIAATTGTSADIARSKIEALTESVEIGRIYTGKVVRTTDFGAFVEIVPGTDGMVHISQLADYRAPTVESVVKVGDEVMVMVTDIDSQGKIRLSRKAVLEGLTPEQAREMDKPRPSSGGDRPRSGGGDRRGGGSGDRRGGGNRDRR